MAQRAPEPSPSLRIAVAGNPNAGKTSLFNRLTGLRQKVANYPGVTVEKKTGQCRVGDVDVELIDLPGTYSLSVQSPDEAVARDVLLGWRDDTPPPDAVLVVVDATNLERNLFLATQIIELGYPTVAALNMSDLARARGAVVDAQALGEALGVTVVETVASRGEGLDELRAALLAARRPSAVRVPLEPEAEEVVDLLGARLASSGAVSAAQAPAVALRLVSAPHGIDEARQRWGDGVADAVAATREALRGVGESWQSLEAGHRFRWLHGLVAACTRQRPTFGVTTTTDRIDRVLTHRVWGPVIFLLLMAVMFQAIYSWAAPFMALIDGATSAVGEWVRGVMPPGLLADLLVDGVITGVGAVVIFLPQILFLFFFLALLEDTGYMSRAAFVMDRLMSRVGLHGRSFVPLLSGFACAIPGIMAARTISSWRDRVTTILVVPLMTCSARLPVYALLIAAFVPERKIWGFLSSKGLTLLGLYLLGIVGALTVAAVLKRTVLRGPTPAMLLELPAYRPPSLPHIGRDLLERAWLFVRFAGSIILSLSVLLWFAASFPRADVSRAPDLAVQHLAAAGHAAPDAETLAAETARLEGQLQLEQSVLGRLGHVIEPVVRPLGFDWRIGVGLLSAFAAREVMVSTLGIIFAVGDEATETDSTLIERLRQATLPDGRLLFTPAVVASLLVFFVFACQCMSTIGVVVRETGGWKWASFMVAYMTVLAYGASLATYQGLRLAGLG